MRWVTLAERDNEHIAVIPAQAGIHGTDRARHSWIPACAGITKAEFLCCYVKTIKKPVASFRNHRSNFSSEAKRLYSSLTGRSDGGAGSFTSIGLGGRGASLSNGKLCSAACVPRLTKSSNASLR